MKLTLTKNGRVIQKNIHADLSDIAIDVENNACFDAIGYGKDRVKAMAINGDEFCWTVQED